MSSAFSLRGREEAPLPIQSRGVIRRAFRRRSGICGGALALLLGLGALFGPFLLSHRPDQTNLGLKLQAPSRIHVLGTDQYGRDQAARLLDGARRSLGAALGVLAGVLILSLLVGVISGMVGGGVDQIITRIIDIILALPPLATALAVLGVLGVGYGNLLLALMASSWAYYARLARSCVRLVRFRQDVIADRLAGVSWPRIVAGHVIPGVMTQLLIIATLDLGGVMIQIASLSFLGLGAQPPDAEWGAMLSESRIFFTVAPWLLLAPTTAIFLSVLAANLISDALRDATNWRDFR